MCVCPRVREHVRVRIRCMYSGVSRVVFSAIKKDLCTPILIYLSPVYTDTQKILHTLLEMCRKCYRKNSGSTVAI